MSQIHGTIENTLQDTYALSVVVPCYNEAQGLQELWQRVTTACQKNVAGNYEFVLVNDGSEDGTWAAMNLLASQDEHVVAINLSRNHGHQIALSAGLSQCRGARILILDADLQDPPELLDQMMSLMDQGADVVYGQRTERQSETWFKRTTAAFFYRLLGRMADIDIPLDTGDFRLINRRTLDILNKMPERCRFLRGMMSWIGLKQVPLAYERQARFAGETKYPFRKMVRFAFDAITGFSVVPMRIASYVGALAGVAGIFLLFYTLLAWFEEKTVPGWTSLMVVVLVIGSVQLVSLGVFGEYLGRMYMEAKQRPLFIIDEIVGPKNALGKAPENH